jgi:glycosyltransferase involved in cell wall biosynthesis
LSETVPLDVIVPDVAKPIVSVLMTAYNREKFIAQAIESVLAQTLTDFELIVVDDGSKDHTIEIARRYTSDKRVQVHVNEQNLGDYPNRNRAANLAKGHYLKYLDSDDLLYPHGLETMVRTMLKYPTAALGLSRPPEAEHPYPRLLSPEQAYREHFLGGGLLVESPTATILLASAFRSMGGFSGKRYIGDVETWLKIAGRHPVVKLMRGLIWWRSHGEQEITAGYGAALGYASLGYTVQLEALSAEDCPLCGSDRLRATRWLKYRHARSILRTALVEHKPQRALEVMRQSHFAATDLRYAFISVNGLQDK